MNCEKCGCIGDSDNQIVIVNDERICDRCLKEEAYNSTHPLGVEYLCGECADRMGWEWPEGHCATAHMGECDVCGEVKSLTCWNDWLIEGKQVEWD